MSDKTNILLITVDDMNYNSIGCFGCPVTDISPNIDRLAAQGMRFDNAHVTIAVCQPSRSVLLTGRYPHHNGARGFEDIDCSVTTLTQVLTRHGFLNGIIGKETHVAPREKFFWDEYVRVMNEEGGFGRSPEVYYRLSKEFFERARQEERPFFLMLNIHDPHRPFAGSEDELNRFGRHPEIDRVYSPDEITVPGFLPDLPDIRKEISQYYSSVHRADQSVGRVLSALKETGCDDNTFVLFLSDNGISVPFSKTNCYLNSTKSPYIARWPGKIKPSSQTEALINGIDFTPTILDLLGLEKIEEVDGKSFLPVLLGAPEHHEDIFTLFFKTNNNKITGRALSFPMRCVQTKHYTYIFNNWSDGQTTFLNESTSGLTYRAMKAAAQNDSRIASRVELFDHRVTEELYHNVEDPDALNNLADSSVHREILDGLRQRMYDYMKTSKDALIDDYCTKVMQPNFARNQWGSDTSK